MRFLFLTQYYPPEIGGPQTRLSCMAEQLIRLGHEVEVVTARPNYPKGEFFDGLGLRLYARERRNGTDIHRVWVYPAMGGGFARMVNYASFALTCLIGLLRCRRPDYLFVESPPLLTSIPGWLAAAAWGAPMIFNVADLWPDAIAENNLLNKGLFFRLLLGLESWSYRRAAYVNAVTEGIHDVLISRKRLPSEKVLFLPNGVDTTRYQERAPDEQLKRALRLEDRRIILWAGTLGFAHGLDNVLNAAKLLEHEPDIHFLFLGDGSARAHLQARASEMRLPNVTFRDPVSMDELAPYYSIAACGLASLKPMPTHDGARPSKMFPVLASGKPLVFVGAGEGAKLVESAQAGVVVEPDKPAALAEQIRRLVRNSSLLRELGGNARRFVEANFDWSLLISRWIGQLRGVQGRASLKTQPSTF